MRQTNQLARAKSPDQKKWTSQSIGGRESRDSDVTRARPSSGRPINRTRNRLSRLSSRGGAHSRACAALAGPSVQPFPPLNTQPTFSKTPDNLSTRFLNKKKKRENNKRKSTNNPINTQSTKVNHYDGHCQRRHRRAELFLRNQVP